MLLLLWDALSDNPNGKILDLYLFLAQVRTINSMEFLFFFSLLKVSVCFCKIELALRVCLYKLPGVKPQFV